MGIRTSRPISNTGSQKVKVGDEMKRENQKERDERDERVKRVRKRGRDEK